MDLIETDHFIPHVRLVPCHQAVSKFYLNAWNCLSRPVLCLQLVSRYCLNLNGIVHHVCPVRLVSCHQPVSESCVNMDRTPHHVRLDLCHQNVSKPRVAMCGIAHRIRVVLLASSAGELTLHDVVHGIAHQVRLVSCHQRVSKIYMTMFGIAHHLRPALCLQRVSDYCLNLMELLITFAWSRLLRG